MIRGLAKLIADYIAPWKEPFLLREIFGTIDPQTVAQQLYAFCEAEFGYPPTEALFFAASVGVVFGLRLHDGQRVVIKVHAPDRSLAFLTEVGNVQRYLAEQGYPCPRPLRAPRPFANGIATVEELIDEGDERDAHNPAIRRAIAEALAQLYRLTRQPERITGLHPSIFDQRLPFDVLWPKPHSALFDFEATAAGAEWIDELARAARQAIKAEEAELVLGHTDFTVKQMRFVGNQLRVIYDWDSLRLEQEPVLVGGTAISFTYTELAGIRKSPTREEALAFVREYEAARGQPFTASERHMVTAGATAALAYTARCEHALFPQEQSYPIGSCRAILAQYSNSFLDVHAGPNEGRGIID
jgi:hypothetical protein